MTQDNQLTMQQFNEQLQELLKKLTTVEKRVSNLENPQLMYKPPQSQSYLTLGETLNDVYKKLEECQTSLDQKR